MRITDGFLLAFNALTSRKLRSFLTTLMVAIGVGLLVGIQGMSNGLQSYVSERFTKLSPNVLAVMVARESGVFFTTSSTFQIDDSVVKSIRTIPGVKEVVPFISTNALVTASGKTSMVSIFGVDPSKITLLLPSLTINEGSLITSSDFSQVLVGYRIAYDINNEKRIFFGQPITISFPGTQNKKTFLVKGIANEVGVSLTLNLDTSIVVNILTLKNILSSKTYSGIFVITVNPSVNDYVSSEISNRYSALRVISPSLITSTINQVFGGINLFLSAIAIVSLLVAVIGIVTTLYTSVIERTREIGVLKSIGFKNFDILLLFLYEATIIGLIGSVSGTFLGFLLGYALLSFRIGANMSSSSTFSQMQQQFMNIQITPSYDISTIVIINLIAIIFSIIAGIYPAYKASRLDPIVALRTE